MLLKPGLLALDAVTIVGVRVGLKFADVISELVVRHDESIHLPRVLDTVGIVVVLRWGRYHHSVCLELNQRCDAIWDLLRFNRFDPQSLEFLLLSDSGVIKQVIGQEANYFMAVFLPKIDGDLNSSTTELLVNSVPHRYVLGIKNHHRLFFHPELFLPRSQIIDLTEDVIIDLHFLDGELVDGKLSICIRALQRLKAFFLYESSHRVLFIGGALFGSRLWVLPCFKVTAQGQKT